MLALRPTIGIYNPLEQISHPENFNPSFTIALEVPITLKEIQMAVASMQAGKTPGEDGLPAKFFKTHCASVATRVRRALLASLRDNALPPCMMRAVIVVIPKPGKDPELCL